MHGDNRKIYIHSIFIHSSMEEYEQLAHYILILDIGLSVKRAGGLEFVRRFHCDRQDLRAHDHHV